MKTIFLKTSIFLLLFWIQFISASTDPPICNPCKITTEMDIISFAPLVLFLGLIIIIFWKLQLENYKIGDSLRENETIDISIDNPSPAKTPAQKDVQDGSKAVSATDKAVTPTPTPPFVGKTIQPQSMSRLLAFISGMVTLAIASCFSSFWLYRYFECETSTKLDDITYVLLTLGLGLTPYAVNKISTAASTTKT